MPKDAEHERDATTMIVELLRKATFTATACELSKTFTGNSIGWTNSAKTLMLASWS